MRRILRPLFFMLGIPGVILLGAQNAGAWTCAQARWAQAHFTAEQLEQMAGTFGATAADRAQAKKCLQKSAPVTAAVTARVVTKAARRQAKKKIHQSRAAAHHTAVQPVVNTSPAIVPAPKPRPVAAPVVATTPAPEAPTRKKSMFEKLNPVHLVAALGALAFLLILAKFGSKNLFGWLKDKFGAGLADVRDAEAHAKSLFSHAHDNLNSDVDDVHALLGMFETRVKEIEAKVGIVPAHTLYDTPLLPAVPQEFEDAFAAIQDAVACLGHVISQHTNTQSVSTAPAPAVPEAAAVPSAPASPVPAAA